MRSCRSPRVDQSPLAVTTSESDLVFPPPPQPLVDSHGGQRSHVESILSNLDSKGQRTSYLVRWRGYLPSHNSWKLRAHLMTDVAGLVEQYD